MKLGRLFSLVGMSAAVALASAITIVGCGDDGGSSAQGGSGGGAQGGSGGGPAGSGGSSGGSGGVPGGASGTGAGGAMAGSGGAAGAMAGRGGAGGGGSGGAMAGAGGAGGAAAMRVLDCDVPLTTAVMAQAGRAYHCAIDFGSSNLKLIVDSIAGQDALSLRGERLCKVALNLGDHVRDPIMGTMVYPPVPEPAIVELLAFVKQFGDQCTKDGGKVIGGDATSWARRAPNAMAILDRAKTVLGGVDVPVLTGAVEGRYGYWAATRGRQGFAVIDAGSSSFQISYWPTGMGAVLAPWSWELGYRQAASDHFVKKDAMMNFTHATYEAARMSWLTALQTAFASTMPPDMTKPMATPAAFATALKAAVTAKTVEPALTALGEDGSLLLLREGKLNPGGKWVDVPVYLQLMADLKTATRAKMADPKFGISAGAITLADTAKMQDIFKDKAVFDALRNNTAAWNAYGPKATGGPVLLEFLIGSLGLAGGVVLVPQEMPDGLILEKLGLAK